MAGGNLISRSTGIEVDGIVYYPLAEQGFVDSCTAVGEGQPCPDEPPGTCICKGGHKYYTLSALTAKGYDLTD